ncbi:hypothetical protein JG687_00016169 [Phytophthora cactorum]|uniref:Uncharacterized protein n=1 Tax=Phytophthora cactorum TaxID=29920 RepID=A0A8T1TSU4_9STRA|nr:hypothetical protein JG687_00016169 [Phytophthora cactorum]
MFWKVQCAARCGARRWARLRTYRAALLRGLPARVCCGCGYARSHPLILVDPLYVQFGLGSHTHSIYMSKMSPKPLMVLVRL